MNPSRIYVSCIAIALTMPNVALAENAAPVMAAAFAQSDSAETQIVQFTPQTETIDQHIEYSYWDEALSFFVIPMGPSVREGAPRVQASTGTRRIYGHESRYRLEGNRVAFSFLTDAIRSDLAEYRQDLERVGSSLNLAALPRNEQLAYWMNLHNVAVVEALASQYPLSEPSEGKFGPNRAGLDDALLVTVKGVSLSPRDIRERIVYPNWRDPKVIYGFFRGEIGGPSIQRAAFTANNVDQLLSISAEEFVNSLRGVERTGKTLRVSRIYEEALRHHFTDWNDLRAHLSEYALDDVKADLTATDRTQVNHYETDIADLSRGERDPALAIIGQLDDPVGGVGLAIDLQGGLASIEQSRINRAIVRLMDERKNKLNKAFKRGIRTGTVIYGGDEENADTTEVE